jgi:hypothetical protein
MAHWAVVVSAERYESERLYSHDTVTLDLTGPMPGDSVALVADGQVFALGRVLPDGSVAYTRRLFDAPVPGPVLDLGAHPLDEATFAALSAEPVTTKREWLVSLDLPIEASSPAEAVRAFWTYAAELGPRELPTFVAPVGDELAMQAYVLGEPTNLDPEEED